MDQQVLNSDFEAPSMMTSIVTGLQHSRVGLDQASCNRSLGHSSGLDCASPLVLIVERLLISYEFSFAIRIISFAAPKTL